MTKACKKGLVLLLAFAVFISAFAGCGLKFETDDTNTVAAVFQKEDIYMNEAKMYIYAAQAQIEEESQYWVEAYYKTYENFWKSDNMWSYCLETAMTNLYQTRVLVAEANEKGITLTAEEEAKVLSAIKDFRDEYPMAIENAKATDEIVKKYFMDNALANKYYTELVKDVNKDFDHDTFTRKSVEGISITAVKEIKSEEEPSSEPTNPESTDESTTEQAMSEETSMEEPSSGSSGETSTEEPTTEEPTTEEPTTEAPTYTEEEQASHRNEALKDILARMQNGEDLGEIVESYKDNKLVTVTNLGNMTITPDDKKTDEAAEFTAYRQVAWDMSTGEYREFTDGDTAYALHSLNDDDELLRQNAENTELENRKSTLFKERYKELTDKKYKVFHVYTKKIVEARFKGSYKEVETEAESETESTESEEEVHE